MSSYQQTLYRLTLSLTLALASAFVAASTTANFASHNEDQIVANDPLFRAWAQQTPPPLYAEHASKLAAHLTWGNVRAIKEFGGIAYLSLHSGCAHKCVGCSLGCDLVPGASKAMTWENFQELVYRLAGLQNALDAIFGKDEIPLISRKWIGPYYDSDPMNNSLLDRQGVAHHIAEIMAFFKNTTGRSMDIWTSGWPSKSQILQKGAKALALAQLAGEDLMGEFRLELKTFTLPFLENLRKIIPPLLLDNPLFQKKFAADLARWGLEIDHYSNPPAAWEIYQEVVNDHWEEILNQSKYFQERLANIETLQALFQAAESQHINIAVRIYFLPQNKFNLGHEIPRLALPFFNLAKMRAYLKEKFGGFLADNLIIDDYWNFSQRTVNAKANTLKIIRVGTGGDLFFLNGYSMFSINQLQAPRHISNLTHRPIFFELPHSPWQEVASRITQVNGRYLSGLERDSIRQQIIASGNLPTGTTMEDLFVSSQVKIEKSANGKFRAYVPISFNHQLYQFDFSQGQMVVDLSPGSQTFQLTEQVALTVPNPHHLSPATEKLIFGFTHFPEQSYQRALALFGFLQAQKYAPIREQLFAPQLAAGPNFLYQSLFPLLGSGFSFLEKQTVELLNEYAPISFFDEFATIFPLYLSTLSWENDLVRQFLRKRIAWNIQNGWFSQSQLVAIKNLFLADGPIASRYELAMLAMEILNGPAVSLAAVDFFREIFASFNLQSFHRLIGIVIYVTHPAIQVPILEKIPAPADLEQHILYDLFSYLSNQKELTTRAQELLFALLVDGSDNQKLLALSIFAHHNLFFHQLVTEIIRGCHLQSSDPRIQASAAKILASSSQVVPQKTSNCVEDLSLIFNDKKIIGND